MKIVTLIILGSLFISCAKKADSNNDNGNEPTETVAPKVVYAKEVIDDSIDFNEVDRMGKSNATRYIMRFDEGKKEDAEKLIELLKTKDFDFSLELNVYRLFTGLGQHRESPLSYVIYQEFVKGMIGKRFMFLDDYSLILKHIAKNPYYLYDMDESKPESFSTLTKFIKSERELNDTELEIVEDFKKTYQIKDL